VRNCAPIFEKIKHNKKVILFPSVRYFRITCCDNREHCINVGLPGYRKNMVAGLEEIKDAIWEQCREDGMTLYKVGSTLYMVGVKVAIEEDELEKLFGKDLVHMTGDGFLALAVGTLKMIENRRTLFVGEKRERVESMDVEGEEVGGWARQNHEWLFETVSGGLEDGRLGRRQKPR
jgi:hypothetical protein